MFQAIYIRTACYSRLSLNGSGKELRAGSESQSDDIFVVQQCGEQKSRATLLSCLEFVEIWNHESWLNIWEIREEAGLSKMGRSALWRAKKSHFHASVECGMKIVDTKNR